MSTLYYYNTNTSQWTSVSVGKAGPQGPEGPSGPAGVIATGETAPVTPQLNDLWVDTSGNAATILDVDAIADKIINRGIIQSIASQSSVSFETFAQQGPVFSGTGKRKFTFPIRGNIQGWIATVNEAPVGGPLVMRLMLNGVMLDEGSILAGSNIMSERQIGLQYVNPSDQISIDIEPSSVTTPPEDLVVTVRWQPKIDNQWFTSDGEKIDVLDMDGIVAALATYNIVTSNDIDQMLKISESDFLALETPDTRIFYIIEEDPIT